jgi:uncharacterized membrane protein
VIADTSMDASLDSVYHRWISWHAPAVRRLGVASVLGVAGGIAVSPFVPVEIVLIIGWDIICTAFLVATGHIITRADGPKTEMLARREDETRATATVLVLSACVISIAAVAVTLAMAGREDDRLKVLLIGVATLTLVLSWVVMNVVFTLRYADLYFRLGHPVIDFGDEEIPSYREFAYLAFTIGMTYQVSDTNLRHPQVRRTVLWQALLSYVFGVVIVASAINLIGGLVR